MAPAAGLSLSRAEVRDLADARPIRFTSPNPKRPGSANSARYDVYGAATTVGEFRALVSPFGVRFEVEDLLFDLGAGNAALGALAGGSFRVAAVRAGGGAAEKRKSELCALCGVVFGSLRLEQEHLAGKRHLSAVHECEAKMVLRQRGLLPPWVCVLCSPEADPTGRHITAAAHLRHL